MPIFIVPSFMITAPPVVRILAFEETFKMARLSTVMVLAAGIL